MFVNYSELLLPSNSSVCIAWSLDSYSQAHKIRLCFFFFWHSVKKTKQNKKQRRYFEMIICFQQGGYLLSTDGSWICIQLAHSSVTWSWLSFRSRSFQTVYRYAELRLNKRTAQWMTTFQFLELQDPQVWKTKAL